MSGAKLTLFLATLVLAAVVGIMLGGMFYFIVKRRKRAPVEETSKMGFVVDTFHQLVATLKEKEKELHALRARAEERAGTIETYNENILQSVPSGVISMDSSWKVVKANAAAARILGLSTEDMKGMDFREIFPAEKMRLPDKRGEAQHTTPSGKRLWLGYSLSPLLDSGGAAIGQLFVFTDLTSLKALEDQAELRNRLSSLGEMSAGIAHELKNSMAVISGYTRLLSRQSETSLEETVDSINSEVSVMDRIITDFQSFTRPRELNLSDVSLRPLIEAASQGALAGRTEVIFSLDVPSDLSIEGDEVLLRQALANLIQNAADAMPEGGNLSVTARETDGTVSVTVSDTGHGIGEDVREKIFLPFYTTKEKGTGLGLAIVHRTVVEHSGEIAIESGDGGTTVRLTLTRRQPARE